MEVLATVLVLFQDLINMVAHLGQLGSAVLGLFGVPELIMIGGLSLNTAGIASTSILIVGIVYGMKHYADVAKWIAGIGGGLLFLSIIGTVIS